MSSRIEIAPPSEAGAAFHERLMLRVEELVGDLALPAFPEVVWWDAVVDPTVAIDGQALLPPMDRAGKSHRSARARAEGQAEAVAAALIRHRWRLLAPHLAALGVTDDRPFREAAWSGLDFAALRDLHEASPNSTAELALLAAERHPPSVELLVSRRDLPAEDDRDFLGAAAASLATGFGLPVPLPTIAADPGLDPATFRLRVGKIRGRVQPEPWDGDREIRLRQALRRQAAEMFDVGSLLALMSDPDRMPADIARAILAEDHAATLTMALRRLLASGIGLVDPQVIGEAVLQPAVTLGDPASAPLALPGALVLAPEPAPAVSSALERRLRAKLVPAHLLRASAASGGLRMFLLGAKATSDLRADLSPERIHRLARELARRLNVEELFTVPTDLAEPLCQALADPLPDLLVIGSRELPAGGRRRSRGTIELKDAPP